MPPKYQENEFKINYKGELPQIDANTFINSLTSITAIIESINKDLATGRKIEIKIKGQDKGSFLVHLQLIAESIQGTISSLLTQQNIKIGASIIVILVGLFEIKKHLKGKKAKSTDEKEGKTIIENRDGKVIYTENTIYKIYKDDAVTRNSINRNFEALDKDPAVTGFELTDIKEKPLLTIDKRDFENMAKDEEKIEEGVQTVTEQANLNIFRIVFDENYKWQFYYHGIRISAKILDDDFHKTINQGEKFAKGDVLNVELEIRKEFDPSVNTFINKSYTINKVIEHIPRKEQMKITY